MAADAESLKGSNNGKVISNSVLIAKSQHTADPVLQPFLSDSFDPASYLNTILPPLSIPGTTKPDTVPLAELSVQAQTLLSQLSAQTARLSDTLTTLTDEILRSGSRLAYEVEVLRGETTGLSELLSEGLAEDLAVFMPDGVEVQYNQAQQQPSRRGSKIVDVEATEAAQKVDASTDPEYLTQLRTLTQVRARLDTVIKTFDTAMSWTMPPSEISTTASFNPNNVSSEDSTSMEVKGQLSCKLLRDEITELLSEEDTISGIEAAARRVEELKELSLVWKGTAEEKGRNRFVEGLARLIEERHKELLRTAEQLEKAGAGKSEIPLRTVGSPEQKVSGVGGFGFMSQLQKMRGGL